MLTDKSKIKAVYIRASQGDVMEVPSPRDAADPGISDTEGTCLSSDSLTQWGMEVEHHGTEWAAPKVPLWTQIISVETIKA